MGEFINKNELVIKIQNEFYPLECDIQRLLKYIAGKGSKENIEIISYIGARGLSLKYKEAAVQIMCMQDALGKNKGRRLYHLIISFEETVKNNDLIIRFAKSVDAMLWEKYQVFYAIHNSTDNRHIHYAINAVSYVTGHKWHMSDKETEQFKAHIRYMWSCLKKGVPCDRVCVM